MRFRTDTRAAAVLLLGLSGCGEAELPLQRVEAGRAEVTGEGLLIIVVDGLRWDHTSLSGYDRDTTPFLAKFAASGVTFTDTWSPSPSLVGSHVSILSGCDPSMARPPAPALGSATRGPVEPIGADDAWYVPSELRLLGRPFLGEGWNTAAFVDHPMIAGLRGFDRGFRSFVEYGGHPEEQDRSVGVFGVGRRFLTWLNRLELDENWFAYVHMNDLERVWSKRLSSPFAPGIIEATGDWQARHELQYFPPVGLDEPQIHSLPPSRASRAAPVALGEYELRYDRGILALDTSLARVIGHVDEFGRSDNITVVVVGSFGMGLGENGLYLLAGLAEEQDLRVPLVIRPSRAVRERLGWPAATGDARTSDALVSLLDVAPTILDLLDIAAPARTQGVSLRPWIARSSGVAADGRALRRNHFASSQIMPGAAIVGADVHFTSYPRPEPEEAAGGRWGAALGPEGGFRPRSPGGAPAALDLALYLNTLARWQTLLLDERRWLHFGVGDADNPRLEEIRRLQSRDLTTR